MDGQFDYQQFDDEHLREMLENLDSRLAPLNFANLKSVLEERGYVVRTRSSGFGAYAALAPEKLEALTGCRKPLSLPLRFGPSEKRANWLEPARNDFRLVADGQIDIDGLTVRLTGRRFGVVLGVLGFLFKARIQIPWSHIGNVEVLDKCLRFEVTEDRRPKRAVTLWCQTTEAAQLLARALPTERTSTFTPKLAAHLALERELVNRAPTFPVTQYLFVANVILFIVMAAVDGGWLTSGGAEVLKWGSNYGPYTSGGDWWRLITAMFIHLGVIHLVFNMWALASFGPTAERLLGSINFLLIYLISGIAGALVSISWSPAVNSVGASGAIFGILGSLLATRFGPRETVLAEYLMPLRTSTLIFAATSMVSGLAVAGVDDANHMGGFAMGFLLGLVAIHPLGGAVQTRWEHWSRRLRAFAVGILILGALVTLSLYRAQSLVGDASFYRETHWFIPRETSSLRRYKAIADRFDHHELSAQQFANEVESKVIPFWKEASRRFAGVQLQPDSHLTPRLLILREVSEKRIEAYNVCAQKIQLNDSNAVADCNAGLGRVDSLINNWKPST